VGIYAEHEPEVLWAAWEFLKFLTSAESSAHFATISGYLPVRRSSLDVAEFKAYVDENPVMAVAASQLEFAAFEPRMPVWESVRNALNRQVGQMLQTPTTDAARVASRMQRGAVESLED
jgi:multiple sugar transport system substrate-binding protein